MRKTKYKSKTPIFEDRWSKNWASRGTEIANTVENFIARSSNLYIDDEPTYRQKLNFLLSKYPYNEFYRSLDNWMKNIKYPLSRKQLMAIDNCYDKVVSKLN